MSAVIDWRKPDYTPIWAERAERLARLRANPSSLPALYAFYAENPSNFICDWGTTFDPRNPERGLPSSVPFLLFERQRELVAWLIERWRAQQHGIVEKSRDMGCSNVLMCFAVTMCLFHRGLTFGVGSRKEELIDRSGDPSSLFFKARHFLANLPPEFLQGWTLKYSADRRIAFPHSDSAITGEAGDAIGRGGRASMYLIDEAAHVERPQLIDASLSATTNCRIDISTPAGRANSFAERRFSGRIPVFTMHWTQHPAKSPEWYARQKATLAPEVLAAEIDLDYSASTTGVLIRQEWVRSAIGAAEKLGIKVSGAWRAALDVADEGRDDNALAIRHGIELKHLESWSGKDSNLYQTTLRTINRCDSFRINSLMFDADGLGSACRGDIAAINEARTAAARYPIADEAFRGSGAVIDAEGQMVASRANQDFFVNRKAMSWWHLRLRLEATHRAVTEGVPIRDSDLLISLSPALPHLEQLVAELTQPSFSLNTVGRIVIDKQSEGTKSPNLADSVMMVYAPREGDHSAGYFSALLEAPAAANEESAAATSVQREAAGIELSGRRACCVIASIAAGVPPFTDVVAVAYWGWYVWALPSSPLICIDWHLEELAGAVLMELLARVQTRMRELIAETNAVTHNTGILLDAEGVGPQLWADAFERGIDNVSIVDENIAALPLSARAVAASGHVLRGKVKASQAAASKIAPLKSTTRNWLSPILGFSARQSPEVAGPLLACVADMVLDTFVHDKRSLAPRKRA